jgi:YqaJ-like viral recombinase domain
MKILATPQGSIEWITNRLWRLTASQMGANITSTGALSQSKTAMKAIDKLIAGIELANLMNRDPQAIANMNERELKTYMSHYNGDSFSGSVHTERGHDCEPDALAALSVIIEAQIDDVGMCVMGDDANGVVACSPDGLIYEGGRLVAGAEVKSPCLCNYYSQLAEGYLPDDYKLQIHAGMAICEVDKWHFGSYFGRKPLFYVEVRRSNFTDTLASSLVAFREIYRDRYDMITSKTQSLGGIL